MSAPALLGCAGAVLCLAVPVIVVGSQVEEEHRAAAIADAAALAAADAQSGWIDAEPCEIAEQVAVAHRARVESCRTSGAGGSSSVEVSLAAPLGSARAAARAGPAWSESTVASDGPIGPSGWAWPSDSRSVSQGFHDGWAIDLAVSGEGALFAPYSGVVVLAGADGAGIPEPCLARPEWWRGPNFTVVIRHEYGGRVLFSSHNHVAPASPQRFGIAPGTPVRAGQRVATAGMSGCTSGPHTHFTLSSNPVNAHPDIDPFAYLGPP
ncbi:Rv3654c family TadE-like protein [Leucobacter triazinivorans]|uniref:M23 family metallopeptidase n=1 Tax=Leucobacter triazinivorans TaxID=1784719 RepID=A0A4P6KF54_9MICO|nr:Rv3654c family TadE-like protein [Leucobacter triazinivorans]QBE48591.1 M23 family metallopeptidase [Leucobacter triazinivorans]